MALDYVVLKIWVNEPDAFFKNGGYMNVNEGQVYVVLYRYPPSYPNSSTLLLNVMSFLRYCDICIDDRHLYKWQTRKLENSQICLFEILVP